MLELNDRLEGPFQTFAKDPAIRKFLSLFDDASAPLKASVQAALINAFASGANVTPAWQPIETAPSDGTNFLAACTCIADEFDEHNRIILRAVRERYVRVAQVAFGGVIIIPFNGGISKNEFPTHWAPMPELPPE